MSPDTVLAKQQLTEINKGLSLINDALILCDKAENCRIPLEERRQILEDQRQTFMQIKSEFFPNAR